MKDLYILELKEIFKPCPKTTYYQHELGSLLMDTKDILNATIFTSIEFCDNLKDEVETDYDYKVKILHYKLEL